MWGGVVGGRGRRERLERENEKGEKGEGGKEMYKEYWVLEREEH